MLRQEGKIRRTTDNIMTIITMKLKKDNNKYNYNLEFLGIENDEGRNDTKNICHKKESQKDLKIMPVNNVI